MPLKGSFDALKRGFDVLEGGFDVLARALISTIIFGLFPLNCLNLLSVNSLHNTLFFENHRPNKSAY